MSEEEIKFIVLMIGQKLEGKKFVCCSKFGFFKTSYDLLTINFLVKVIRAQCYKKIVRNLQIFVTSKGVLELA
jgi:hypothetical protein